MQAVVVIPTYNERENLEPLVEKLWHHASELHVLIVDDNSPDGTGRIADELSRKNPGKLFVLHRQNKDGLGRAYVEGFKHALQKDYEIILQMDADLSHDPSYLPLFLEQLRHASLVLGSRYLHGISVVNWDFKRLMLSKMATKYVRLITRMPFTDTTGGFKCWRRETLEAVGLEAVFSNGYLFQIEMTFRAYKKGFKVVEIPIIFIERNLGRSKMSWAVIWEAIWGVLRLKLKSRSIKGSVTQRDVELLEHR
ncbi:MAG: polyprenol monophosphomannose synthase [Pyrinomonadaceae bacterium]|nr:polyprenol monophosphomannose synthase [Pyrinomonadaceae bacterium]